MANCIVHSTHEAAFKRGGIGQFIRSLIKEPEYRQKAGRIVLAGQYTRASSLEMERLNQEIKIKYSIREGVYDLPEELARRLSSVALRYNADIIYGHRREDGVEVLLVDPARIYEHTANVFKRRVYDRFGLESDRYEKEPEFDFYMKAGEPLEAALHELLTGEEYESKIIVAHDFMGLPLVYAAVLNARSYTTMYLMHEVSSVRELVEKSEGHDIMFYNILLEARKKKLFLEDIFGSQRGSFKHAMLKTASSLDRLAAVSDVVVEEFRFVDSSFSEKRVDVLYGGTECVEIDPDTKLRARKLLKEYAKNLISCDPQFIFTHVGRLIPSKGFWRDLAVLKYLDRHFAATGRTGIFFILGSTNPLGRTEAEVLRMEREYGWPVFHKEGWPDLVAHEKALHDGIVSYNASATNIKAVLVNQYGWSRKALGERCPADMDYRHLRFGTDVEFGQSIYEPFGLSPLEAVSAGAIAVLSDVTGSARLLSSMIEKAAFPNIILAPYSFSGGKGHSIESLKNMSRAAREEIENQVASEIAMRIMELLPRNEEQMMSLVESGRSLALKLSWREMLRRHLLPLIGR